MTFCIHTKEKISKAQKRYMNAGSLIVINIKGGRYSECSRCAERIKKVSGQIHICLDMVCQITRIDGNRRIITVRHDEFIYRMAQKKYKRLLEMTVEKK